MVQEQEARNPKTSKVPPTIRFVGYANTRLTHESAVPQREPNVLRKPPPYTNTGVMSRSLTVHDNSHDIPSTSTMSQHAENVEAPSAAPKRGLKRMWSFMDAPSAPVVNEGVFSINAMPEVSENGLGRVWKKVKRMVGSGDGEALFKTKDGMYHRGFPAGNRNDAGGVEKTVRSAGMSASERWARGDISYVQALREEAGTVFSKKGRATMV